MAKVDWVECEECEQPLIIETCDLMLGKLYFYCDNEECEAHQEEREYFIELDMAELHW